MANELEVYINNIHEGTLKNGENGGINFQYDDLSVLPISVSLPVRKLVYNSDECHGFFNGLLPESEQTRKRIGLKYGINPNNDFALLKAIGYDCPGAIAFINKGEENNLSEYYDMIGVEISDIELETLIKELPQKPLGTGVKDMRLSLAGAQDKTAVLIKEDKIFLPAKNTPTTHIIKPEINGLSETAENEYICLKAAEKSGINTINAELRTSGKTKYLITERFDRVIRDGKIKRLHQEDFCQALNIASAYKCEQEGGVSFKQSFEVLRKTNKAALNIKQFINRMIFNYLILNNDAHGKNYSLLYTESGELELAPVYDILCTKAYSGLSSDMAMEIGGCYDIGNVLPEHFKKLADEVGISYTGLRQSIINQCEILPDILKDVVSGFENKIGTVILNKVSKHCRKNLKLFKQKNI